MNERIERVARAMCVAEGRDPERMRTRLAPDGLVYPAPWWTSKIEDAQALLAELGEKP